MINGERVAAKSGEEMRIINPATGDQFDSVSRSDSDDVNGPVQAGKAAYK